MQVVVKDVYFYRLVSSRLSVSLALSLSHSTPSPLSIFCSLELKK